MNRLQMFREAIRSSGLEPPDAIEADGKIHRFSSNGKRGDDAGWYVLHADGIAAGAFGDWRTGVSQTWRADLGRPLTLSEVTAQRAKLHAIRRERETEEKRRHAETATKAAEIWKTAQPAPDDHPYLIRKRIKAHGVRVHKGALAIPMRANGELQSLQFIDAEGEKRFLTGGRVAGCYFAIGDPKGAPALCIAEGFATGATIHEATGYPVAVAFNAGNLETVARAIRTKFPDLTLILCADDDTTTAGNPGLTKATEAARAVGGKLAIPDFGPNRPMGATDFNDMAVLHGPSAVAQSIRDAKPVSESHAIRRTKQGRTPITVKISEVQREEVSWLWHHRIPRGKLTIIEGDPGVGKSFLSQAIAATITVGVGLPGEARRAPEPVVLMSAEDGLSDTIRPRLEEMGADLSRVIALRGLIDDEGKERPLTLADLDVIGQAISEHQPALVVIDPIIAYVAGKDTHKANEVRSLLAPLAALADEHKAAVLAIRHLNKSTAKAAYRGQGSIDFLAACRSAFVAGEDPGDPGRKVICHVKSNLGPKTASLTYTVHEGRFCWGEETNLTADQIVAAPTNNEDRSEQNEAKEFLRSILAQGPVSSNEVKEQAKAAGINERTLWRAKKALKIRACKESFGRGWLWNLADEPEGCQQHAKGATVTIAAAFDDPGTLRGNNDGWETVP